MSRSITSDYGTVTPYLAIKGAAAALEFYQKAFGAVMRAPCLIDPAGNVAHAEIIIGDSIIMLGEESVEWSAPSPLTLGGTSVKLALRVDDVDASVDQAVNAGATLVSPVADLFYGERSGRVADPYGHVWIISTRIEHVSSEEMQRRFDDMCATVK